MITRIVLLPGQENKIISGSCRNSSETALSSRMALPNQAIFKARIITGANNESLNGSHLSQ